MPEIGTSSLMSGEGRRSACATPRLSSTLPLFSGLAHCGRCSGPGYGAAGSEQHLAGFKVSAHNTAGAGGVVGGICGLRDVWFVSGGSAAQSSVSECEFVLPWTG